MSKGFKRYLSLIVTAFLLFFMFSASSFTSAEKKSNSNTVYLNGIEIKAHQKIEIPDELKKEYSNGEVGPYIVVFNGPVYESMKLELENIGAKIVEYIPDFSFLTLMTPEIAKNAEELSFVDDVIIYQPAFKIHPALKDSSENVTNNAEIKVNIITFDDTSLENEIAEVGGEKLDKVKNKIVVIIKSNEIKKLAKLNSVKYIEPAPEYKLYNDIAKGYMAVDDMWNLGYKGAGQVVGVCDTGLDTGRNDNSMHLDFQGRINAIYALGRNTADDPHGHGTHVSGSVLGSGARSNGQYKGIAPEASLVMQSVLDSGGGLGGLPNDLNTLFAQSWNSGARIHTNSWGAAVNGQYTTDSQNVDEYVWNNDMVILFAAGNEGDGYFGTVYDSISAPGTAKNCITVGASENYRPTMPDIGWGNISNNPNEIAPYSSRGNCTDGRIKPDIVAPGTWILSTKSSVAPVSNYWQGFNNYYAYMGGTSMSTPLTAGAVAVAREYMEKQWGHTPSPAMMKAAIINGGTDMGFGYPSRDQGWGRISLTNSLTSKEYKYEDETIKLATGQSQSYTYSIEAQNAPFKVSLVWTDYPGSTTSSKALVNDLDLKITSPTGTVYYGNDFTSPYSSGFDRINNVENVYITTPEVGNYTIEIKGYNVPQGPQDFTLFSSGNFDGGVPSDTEPPTCSITTPINNDTVSGMVTLSANATDNNAVNRVEFYVDGIKVGTDTTNPYSIEWDSTTAANGTHSIQAKAFDGAGNIGASTTITVTTDNIPKPDTTPPTCNLTAPADGSTVKGMVTINADASDNNAVNRVEFYVGETKVGEDATIQYSIGWDSTTVVDGVYNIQAKAFDEAGNVGVSQTIAITVKNTTIVNYDTKNFTGNVNNKKAKDITINVTAQGTIDISLSGGSGLSMELYDPSGVKVGEGTSTIQYIATQPGIYKISISTTSKKPISYNLTATYPVTGN